MTMMFCSGFFVIPDPVLNLIQDWFGISLIRKLTLNLKAGSELFLFFRFIVDFGGLIGLEGRDYATLDDSVHSDVHTSSSAGFGRYLLLDR